MIGEQTPYRYTDDPHVHAYDNKEMYGTTTVLEVLGKVLTYWASGLAVGTLGWLNPKKHSKEERLDSATLHHALIGKMNVEEYQTLLDRAYKAHSIKLKDTASAGVDLHAAVEAWIKAEIGQGGPPLFIIPELESFLSWASANVKKFLWSEVCHYSSKLFVGGKSDFIYMDMQDRIVLGDIKSSPKVYFNHFAQGGGYSIQIKENGLVDAAGKRLAEPFKVDRLAIFPFGGGFVEPVYQDNVEEYEEAFKAALTLFKSKKSYEKGEN